MFGLHLETKIREIEQQEAARKRAMKELLEKMQVTSEQLNAFYNNPSNFSQEEWKEFQKQKKEFDAEIQKELQSILDPLQAQANRASLTNIPRHAIFVR